MMNTEMDWYPCPCGGQLCSFCFEQCMQLNGRCPYCRRKYYSDAAQRIGAQYRPEPKSTTENVKEQNSIQVVDPIYVLSKTMVEILGIPQKIFNPMILKRKEYLGQYGRIKRVACYIGTENPFTKISKYFKNMSTSPGYVYVEFETESEAKSCILSLNGTYVMDSSITACYALTEYCPDFMHGKECSQTKCMKMHQKVDTKKEITFQPKELDQPKEKLKPYLNIQKPPNYDSYPKRAFGIPVLPPPRLIPPSNGNGSFIIRSVGKYGQPNAPLFELIQYRDAIPMPYVSRRPQNDIKNLVDLLGLRTK